MVDSFIEAPNNFYLGARVDPKTHELLEDDLIYYDAFDLTTHGVILGMTGSGKSGLGITLLEEAAIDGIPQIIIDPKGDLTNMVLAFPELSPEYLLPWVNLPKADDAERRQYAQDETEHWRQGLAEWGIDEQRLQAYRRSARFNIYTPGSDAGIPVSVLASFAAPAEGWEGNEEVLREQLAGTASALLGLIGVSAQPVQDPEHILLANIFEHNWSRNQDVSPERLISQVQSPPFEKLGALPVDSVISQADRTKLAKQINHIIAAPGFKNWLHGEPIDIPGLLYTPEGHPQVSIFYLAHLEEAERQFVTALILENLITWMHTLSGANSLRALLYIDEMYGMMPPHPYNPPTKGPIMRLLKQARALGIGVLMATQNAKDIDYKGLANAGTWFIGKLQTENDRKRVLEGLHASEEMLKAANLTEIESLIGELKPREFIRYNIHDEDQVLLMKTRWSMSYLTGPLNRAQISALMEKPKQEASQRASQRTQRMLNSRYSSPQEELPPATSRSFEPGASRAVMAQSEPPMRNGGDTTRRQAAENSSIDITDLPGFAPVQPSVSGVSQYFLPLDYTVEQALWNLGTRIRREELSTQAPRRLLYQPSLLAQASVRFTHRQTNSSQMLWYGLVVPDLPPLPVVEWQDRLTEPFDPRMLDANPYPDAYFGSIPPELVQNSGFSQLKRDLNEWLYQNITVTVSYNPTVDMYSALGEERSDYISRLSSAAREAREDELRKVVESYNKRIDKLEDSIDKKVSRLEAEQEELQLRKQEEFVNIGETAARLMRGSIYRTFSRVAEVRRRREMTGEHIEVMQEDIGQLLEEVDQVQAEMEQALQQVRQRWELEAHNIEDVVLRPNKKDINVALFGLGWVPYWYTTIDGQPALMPATASGLSRAQRLPLELNVLG